MIQVTDRNNNILYASYTRDGSNNPDGFHCDIYSDKGGYNKVDSITINPLLIYDYFDLEYPKQIQEIEKYIRDFCANSAYKV